MTVTTTRAQFKACLANDAARARIGINLTDAQALGILSSDASTDQWYDWWSRRPRTVQASPAPTSSARSAQIRQLLPQEAPEPTTPANPRLRRSIWLWVTIVTTSLLLLLILAAGDTGFGVVDVLFLLGFWNIVVVALVASIRYLIKATMGR
ncbi:hypothetical protein [Microbacterium marmarense]|uniref:DUF1707 domain-containing protein n=1 Tax=Microbacterium marmarense TaxID=3122051 RepID=A0ABU8LRT6_9MICO